MGCCLLRLFLTFGRSMAILDYRSGEPDMVFLFYARFGEAGG